MATSPDSEPLTQPQGEVVAMRIFRNKPASDSSITSSGALDCSFNYCYSRDFSYVAAGWYVDGDSGLQGAHVGYVDTDDNITDISAAVPSPLRGTPIFRLLADILS